MNGKARVAVPDDTFEQLLGDHLPKTWADLPADDDGVEVAMAFIRAAYGRGYVRALEVEAT